MFCLEDILRFFQLDESCQYFNFIMSEVAAIVETSSSEASYNFSDGAIECPILATKDPDNLPWWVSQLPVIRLVPMPFVVLAIFSSWLSYVTASNLKSDQASVTVIKYMSIMDMLFMANKLNVLVQSK